MCHMLVNIFAVVSYARDILIEIPIFLHHHLSRVRIV